VQKPRRWSLNRVGHPPRFDGNFMGFNGDDTISHTHTYIYIRIYKRYRPKGIIIISGLAVYPSVIKHDGLGNPRVQHGSNRGFRAMNRSRFDVKWGETTGGGNMEMRDVS
jgi:hypothetical protein